MVLPALRRRSRPASSLKRKNANVNERTSVCGARPMVRLLARGCCASVAEKSNAAAKMWPTSGVMKATRSAESPVSQSMQSPPLVSMPRPQWLPMRPAASSPKGSSTSPYARRTLSTLPVRALRQRRVGDAVGLAAERDVVERVDARLHGHGGARRVHVQIGAQPHVGVRERLPLRVAERHRKERDCPLGSRPRSRSRL